MGELLIYQWKLMKIDELMMDILEKQLDKRSVIDNHPSQPGGPWQAGAGGLIPVEWAQQERRSERGSRRGMG